jgi:hypothetical protein
VDGRARKALRCQGLGRPQFVIPRDQSFGDHPELDIKSVEVLGEKIALQLMLNSAGHEATQAAIADTGFDTGGESLLDAH